MKKKITKKLISGLLALLMVFSILPETVHAEGPNGWHADLPTWNDDLSSEIAKKIFPDEKLVKVSYPVTFNQTEARKMLPMVNKFRTSGSWLWNEDNTEKEPVAPMDALKWDYGLEKKAMIRAAETAAHWDHIRPNGLSSRTIDWDVMNDYKTILQNWNPRKEDDYHNGGIILYFNLEDEYFGLQYNTAENISTGHGDAKDAFEGWKEENQPAEEQGHRALMLSDAYKYVGIARCETPCGGSLWVMEVEEFPYDLTETPADNSTITFTTHLRSSWYKPRIATTDFYSTYSFDYENKDYTKPYTYIKVGATKKLPDVWILQDAAALALNDPVVWTSNNPSVVEVSGDKFTVKSKGTAVLSTTLKDPVYGKEFTQTLEVRSRGYAKSYITKLLNSFTPKILNVKGGKHRIKVKVKKFSKLPVVYQIEGKLVKNGKIVDRVKSGYGEEPRETFTRSGIWGSFTSGTWKFRTRVYHYDRDSGKTYYSKWSSWRKVKVK